MTDGTDLSRRFFLGTAAVATAAPAVLGATGKASAEDVLTSDEYIALAKAYLATVDARGDVFALMADDIEFTNPKWGTARGKDGLRAFFKEWGRYVAAIRHPQETFKFLVNDRRVAVEGISMGQLRDGKTWVSGRFCVIYDFEGRLVKRVNVYTDPDYCDQTKGLYPWNHA